MRRLSKRNQMMRRVYATEITALMSRLRWKRKSQILLCGEKDRSVLDYYYQKMILYHFVDGISV